MDTFDFVIIGAGPAGEAAAHKARELGASRRGRRPALVRRQLSAHRLHPVEVAAERAARHAANPASYAGRRRRRGATTWSIAPPTPTSRTTRGTSTSLEAAGAIVYRGAGRIVGRGRVAITPRRHDPRARGDATSSSRSARHRRSRRSRASPTSPSWTNHEATLARELPASLLVLGGGPTGCELAQVYARFGVPTTIVQSGPRLAPTDHPRNSAAIKATLLARRRRRPARRPGASGARRRRAGRRSTSSTSTTARRAEGHAILLAVGREFPIDDLGLEHYGIDTDGADAVPARRPAAGRRRAVGRRRPRRARAAHAPGPLPGRARGPDGARRGHQARLPGAAAGDLHGSRGGVGGPDARPGARRRASTRSSSSPSSRRPRRATRSRRRSGT